MNLITRSAKQLIRWTTGSLALCLIAASALGQTSLTQTTPILINDATRPEIPVNAPSVPSAATPYPSSITTSSLLGNIERVTVQLNGVTHAYPDDIDVILRKGAKTVRLMSDAGGRFSLVASDLTFADAAAGLLPDEAIIANGIYKPTDYDAGDGDVFPSPAPTPTDTTLAAFITEGANGVWELFVSDDTKVDGGSIASWTLNVFTTPTLSVANTTIATAEDVPVSVPLTVKDSDTALSALTFKVTSNNTALVASANVVVTGEGQNRILTISPKANANGTATVTVVAEDGIGDSVSLVLTVNVSAVNDAPQITLSTNKVSTIAGKATAAINATVADIDSDLANLTFSATSSNPDVVTSAGLVVTGDGATRNVIIAPNGAASGNATLTIFVTDNATAGSKTHSVVLDVTVTPVKEALFANTTSIAINDNLPATPFPSTVTVSNVAGLVGRLEVTLADVNHPRPEDLSVLVVGPGGQKLILMRAAGGANPLSRGRIVFSNQTTSVIPDNGSIVSGFNQPFDYSAGDVGGGAPSAPYSTELSAFNATNPNGVWSLYVVDSAVGQAGNIAGGFILQIYSAPSINGGVAIAAQSTPEETVRTVTFAVGDHDGTVTNLTVTVGDSNLVAAQASFAGGTGTVVLTPKLNQFGSTLITVVATDNHDFQATSSFTLTVTSVNDAPTIAPIAKQIVRVGGFFVVNFTIGDVDNGPDSLTVTAASSNSKLVPVSGVVLSGTGTARVATIFPKGILAGASDITLTVSDGSLNAAMTFPFNVEEPAVPLFDNPAQITVNSDKSTATAYPSTVSVAGLLGDVVKVDVHLLGLVYTTPRDLDVLLVSPGGTPIKVMLMSDVGGDFSLSATSLFFTDGAPTLTGDRIVSGRFNPTDLDPDESLAAPAPGRPYGANLSALNGIDPNGTWSLYINDDALGVDRRGGVIFDGWQLSIQTSTKVAAIADQTTDEDVAKRVTVVIGDNQPGVAVSVTTTISGTPADLISSIAVSGSGTARTLLITPKANVSGTNTVQVTVTDNASSSSRSFKFIVNPVNDTPTISGIVAEQSTPAAIAKGPINFTVNDVETSAGNLIVTVTSSNQALVPDSNIAVNNGGAGNWNLTILPVGVETGRTTITVTVAEPVVGGSQKTSVTFVLTVNPSLAFANSERIVINDTAPATPYPSKILVSRVDGLVSRASVVLQGFKHTFPADVDVLLVSPDGKQSILMADAGGGTAVSNLRLEFNSEAGAGIPQGTVLSSGTFLPANHSDGSEVGEVGLPSPAPAGNRSASLANFNGATPSGEWKLFVGDDVFSESGAIEGGWILILETSPIISSIPPQVTLEDVPLVVPFNVSDSDTGPTGLNNTVTATLGSPANLVLPAGIVISTNTSNNRTVTITPTANLSGTNLITLSVTDGTTTATTSFGLTVTPVNDAPTLTTATNMVFTSEDVAKSVVFNVADMDSILRATSIVVTSSNPDLLPNKAANIVITAADIASGVVTVNFVPTADASGSTVLTFSIKDEATTASVSLTLNVSAVNDLPTISGIGNQFITVGEATTNLLFTVGDIETPARNLVVSASSGDQTLVPNANIVLGGSAGSRSIQVTTVGNTAGSSLISVVVSDGTASVTTTFTVNASLAGTVFANAAPITIRDNNTATPSPSEINVFGLTGGLFTVKVTLDGLSHTAPDDVDVLLVHVASGKKVTLLSDAGGRNPVTNTRLRFDDATSGRVSDDAPIVSGIYAPSNYEGADTFPGAPAGPYAGALAEFKNIDPNGLWRLFVVDDTANDSGQIAFGWSLEISVNPTIALTAPTPLVVNEDQLTSVNFNIGGDTLAGLTLIASSDNKILLPNETVTFTPSVAASTDRTELRTANLKFAQDGFGTNNLTITVRRVSDGAQSSVVVPILVNSINDSSTISRLANKSTVEGVAVAFEVLFTDVDTASTNLTVTATSSNQTLISNTGLMFGKTNRLVELPTGPILFTLQPNNSVNGTSTITFTLRDSGPSPVPDVVSAFVLTVTPFNDPPTISAIATMAIPSGTSTTNINFTLGDAEGDVLTVSAKSSDQTLVKDADITVTPLTGGGGVRTVKIKSQPGVEGSTTITLTITDNGSPAKSATSEFKLNVRPTRERIFANTRQIVINDNGPATDYPSVISVSGLVGKVSKVTVKLNGFAHLFPDDVDVLLVSPNGTKAILMSDAGGGVKGTNLVLNFDQSVETAIEDGPSGGLVSGTYKPANYEASADVFAAPAPAAPYGESLNAFNGGESSGNWSLYIVDDTPSDSGFVTGGWSLGITTEPIISGLSNLTIAEDGVARQTFSISEESTSSTDFTFILSSTNKTLVPDANIVVSGSGLSRSITITPASNVSGETDIKVQLTNLDGQVMSSTFHLTVTVVNDAPVITAVPSQVITAGSLSDLIAFDYSDVEKAKKDLVLTIESSNAGLIPVSNIVIIGSELRVVAAGPSSGKSTIALTVSDGALSATTSFLVTVTPSLNPVFAATGPIVINDNGKASPYASEINVAGVNGTILKVTVTLADINHSYPDDIDVLLVGPNGQKVVLMSDAGAGGTDASKLVHARITFDDAAPGAVPDNAAIANLATYKPSNYEGAETFPAPAPGTPYEAALNAFNGTNPNGTWSLYVIDDASPDAGSIAGGWQLNLVTTAPVVAAIQDVTTTEEVPTTVAFKVGSGATAASDLVVRGSVSDTRLATVTNGGSGTDRNVTITPLPNATGEATVTISVSQSDGSNPTSSSFKVTVTPVNDVPLLAGLGDFTAPANIRRMVDFTVFDVETPATGLTVGATISDTAVGTVSVTGAGSVRTLVFNPAGVAPAKATITVTLSDGVATSTTTILATVTAPLGPKINPIGSQSADEDTAATVAFSVTVTGSSALTLTGTGANPSLVTGVTVVPKGVSGSEFFANIALVPNAVGTSFITVTATDEFGTDSKTFDLTVRNVNDAPVLAPIPDQTTPEDMPLDVAIGVEDIDSTTSALAYSATISNSALVTGVAFTKTVTGAVARLSVAPNQSGVSTITVSVTDGTASVSRTFALNVVSVDDAPALGSIADQSVSEDIGLNITLDVSDSDTAVKDLGFSFSTSNAALVSGVSFVNDGTSVLAVVRLVANANGAGTVTISANDTANTVSKTFALTVTPVDDAPVLGDIANQVTDEDTNLPVALSLTDIDSSISGVVLSGTSSSPALVSGITFNNDGTSVVANVQLVANANGTATVTIVADDGTYRVEKSFKLTVTPVDDAPVLAVIPNETMGEDTGLTIILNIIDSDTAIKDLVFAGSSTKLDVVSGVDFTNDGTLVVARVRLVPNANGRATVTITASDSATTVAQTFVLNITPVTDAPSLGDISAKTTTVGQAVSFPLVLSDVDTALKDLVLTGLSSSAGLVSGVSFANDGTSVVATIDVVAGATGTADVTISVTDGIYIVDKAFTLTITGQVAAPAITASTASGQLKLTVTGTPGAKFIGEGSTDLVNWILIGILTIGADGTAEYVPDTRVGSVVFFRLRSE